MFLVLFKQVKLINAQNKHILLQKASYLDKVKEEFKMTNKWLMRWKETALFIRYFHREKQDLSDSAADNWLKAAWPTV